MKQCTGCFNEIPLERLEILPNTKHCVKCSVKLGPKKVLGANVFYHKTAPSIQIMEPEFYKNNWMKYNSNFGRGSGLHKIMKSTSNY
jgi:hypothetical protein